jgi:hypothetical protein
MLLPDRKQNWGSWQATEFCFRPALRVVCVWIACGLRVDGGHGGGAAGASPVSCFWHVASGRRQNSSFLPELRVVCVWIACGLRVDGGHGAGATGASQLSCFGLPETFGKYWENNNACGLRVERLQLVKSPAFNSRSRL